MFDPNIQLMTEFFQRLLPAIKETNSTLFENMQSMVYFGDTGKADFEDFKHVLKEEHAVREEATYYKGYERAMFDAIIDLAMYEEVIQGRSLDELVETMEKPGGEDEVSDDVAELCFRCTVNIEKQVAGEQSVVGPSVLVWEDTPESKKKEQAVKAIPASEILAVEAKLGKKADGYHIDTWNPYIGGAIDEVKNSFVQKGALEVANNLVRNGFAFESISDAGNGMVKIFARTRNLKEQVEVYLDQRGVPQYFLDVQTGKRHDFDESGKWQDALGALTVRTASNPEDIIRRAESDPGTPKTPPRRGPTRTGTLKIDPSAYSGLEPGAGPEHSKEKSIHTQTTEQMPNIQTDPRAITSQVSEVMQAGGYDKPSLLPSNADITSPFTQDVLGQGLGVADETKRQLQQRQGTTETDEQEDANEAQRKKSRKEQMQQLADQRDKKSKQKRTHQKAQSTLADSALRGTLAATGIMSFLGLGTSFMM